MSPRPAFKALAVFFGFALFFLLDFGIRQVYLRFWKKPFLDVAPLRVPDETFHHGIKPNAEAVDTYGPHSAKYFSNSLGLRDEKIREVSLNKTGPRILFIGDSFTEGGSIPWEKTFVGRVASALKPRGIEVLNAGVASYCPATEKVKLRTLLMDRGLKVDRVVVFVDISDVADELYYEEMPDGKIRQIPYGPFHAQAERLQKIDAVCDWLEKNVENNFVILGAVVRNVRLQWRRHGDRTGVAAYDKIPLWKYNWPDYQGEFQEFVERGLKEAQESMTGIAKMVREKGIALTVAVYPWPQQVRAGSRPSRAEKEWSHWAQKNGAEFINLFPAFVNQMPAEEIVQRYYWRNDCHWNEFGHALVAEEILKSPNKILPPSRRTPLPKP